MLVRHHKPALVLRSEAQQQVNTASLLPDPLPPAHSVLQHKSSDIWSGTLQPSPTAHPAPPLHPPPPLPVPYDFD